MSGAVNLAALRAAGAAINAAPAPVAPVEPWAEELRATFDPAYAHELDVAAGRASRYSGVSGRVAHVHGNRPETRLNARSAATEPRCGDCGALRSSSVTAACGACGSTQPPRLDRMNPRAAHMVGEAPLR